MMNNYKLGTLQRLFVVAGSPKYICCQHQQLELIANFFQARLDYDLGLVKSFERQ